MTTLLLIEDDPKIAATIVQSLQTQTWNVNHVITGEAGFFEAQQHTFDLIILDLMLPVKDGYEILAALRKQGNQTPVLILSAKCELDDRVRGLDIGADGYLAKPFSFVELHACIRALTRRGAIQEPSHLSAGNLQLDRLTRSVTRAGEKITLTKLEFDLLYYFLQHQGEVIPRYLLAKEVWHQTQRSTPLDNVIDVHMSRLRKRLVTKKDNNKLIHTIRGVGYMLSTTAP
ncbi:MAG TPA: response regulator transcription factor [Thiothrix sp.]|nr:response regulator transcription factor [Thiothrix sp.]